MKVTSNQQCQSMCRETVSGQEYIGHVNVSISGKRCLQWKDTVAVLESKDASIEDAENFCRNPDYSEDGLWCYVEGVVKEYCHVPFCQGNPSILIYTCLS